MEAHNIDNDIQYIRSLIASNGITIENIISFLNEKLLAVHLHLTEWKRDQLLVTYGDRFVGDNNNQALSSRKKSQFEKLDQIQSWFEDLARIIWDAQKLLNSMNTPGFEQAYNEVINILKTLAESSLIIEMQPSQVIKVNTRYDNHI